MLLRGMVRMDMARRLNAYRVLSLALCSLALVGEPSRIFVPSWRS